MVLHKHVAYLEDKKISQQLRSVFTSEQLPQVLFHQHQ